MVKTPHARRATKYLGIGLLVLFLVALLAVACVSQKSPVPPARQVATSPPLPSQPRNLSESTPAPSAPPPDALAVVATTAHAMAHPETPATVGPGGYSTLMVVRDTAVAVRATASPFPTAGPPTVQPGQPARVFAQRGGLSLRLEVTKDTYLAGEGGRAEIALSNDGPETLFIFCPQDCLRLALVDEQSQQIAFSPFPLPYERSFPRFPYKFMPGQTLTETHTFNVPSAEQVSGHTYTLWASIFFSRPDPGSLSTLPDGLFLALEAGPLLLKVTLPSTRQLRAELQADRSGWRLRVTDANGQVPAGPFWGLLVADQPGFFSKSAFASQPLRDSPDGTWSGSWRRSGFDAAPIAVRAWVAAPGYTTAVAAYTVPPKTYPTATTIAATPAPLETRGSIVSEPPLNQGFPTLAEARAASKLRIYEPRWLPASMVLEWVYVNVSPEQRYCEPVEPGSSSVKCSPIATFYAFVHQYYRLPDKRQMEIIQRIPPEPCLYPGCRPFSDREAQAVAIGEVTGYLVRQYGWWTLAWETGGSHFTVRAPVESISREDLLALAAAMRP